jgi:hypothetical protein
MALSAPATPDHCAEQAEGQECGGGGFGDRRYFYTITRVVLRNVTLRTSNADVIGKRRTAK